MIVSLEDFTEVLDRLRSRSHLSLDCETTGLRPYHGSTLFSIIISDGETSYYFNFNPSNDPCLGREGLLKLSKLLQDPDKTWYMHNAKFDLHMLGKVGLEVAGDVHCTQAIARVEYNDHMSYSLDACAKRIGESKDDAVEKYISEHNLWEWEEIPGKKTRARRKFFDRVPFKIIAPYAERDAYITYRLGRHQEETLQRISHDNPQTLPTVLNVAQTERRLTRVVFEMERQGLRIDRKYCVRAARYEADRAEAASQDFRRETGRDFKSSGKLFADVFRSEQHKWTYTDKGNPSFEGDILKRFTNPAARYILEYRDAKSKADFYHGFLYHADADDVIHPNLNPAGTNTGRFSSSDPNFQNLTSEEDEELNQEFVVRRAIIPRPGFFFIMPDYDQMEYRMMLDYAGAHSMIEKIKGGLDVHEATAQLAGITRKQAKTTNFAILYGAGLVTLSEGLGVSLDEARRIRSAVFQASPEIQNFIRQVVRTAEHRKYIINWAGRRSHFEAPDFAYRAVNYLIQGGCADVVKQAMVKIHDALRPYQSRLVLTVHDELPIEVHESEAGVVPRLVQEIMQSVYPHKLLPLTVGMEFSHVSLGDKQKGSPA